MVIVFTIKTPNVNYNGVTEGVKFNNGEAEVLDETMRNVLVNNYGYLDATVTKKTESKPEEKPKQKRKSSAK